MPTRQESALHFARKIRDHAVDDEHYQLRGEDWEALVLDLVPLFEEAFPSDTGSPDAPEPEKGTVAWLYQNLREIVLQYPETLAGQAVVDAEIGSKVVDDVVVSNYDLSLQLDGVEFWEPSIHTPRIDTEDPDTRAKLLLALNQDDSFAALLVAIDELQEKSDA